ncbi:hypothetical protein H5410_052180 [Solanum commersonii]|uniref:Retrotransposon gag domain-containing protein n=1 Tax=Solanum commersonii TaxID=4109 RepID=A0A9J5X048_SOLCO|nr:hypothetical protein H5410_052180 [Solanum commersonii]
MTRTRASTSESESVGEAEGIVASGVMAEQEGQHLLEGTTCFLIIVGATPPVQGPCVGFQTSGSSPVPFMAPSRSITPPISSSATMFEGTTGVKAYDFLIGFVVQLGYLRGIRVAKEWWRSVLARRPVGSPILGWEQFTKCRDEFDRLDQGSLSFSKYATHFYELSHYAISSIPTEFERICQLVKGVFNMLDRVAAPRGLVSRVSSTVIHPEGRLVHAAIQSTNDVGGPRPSETCQGTHSGSSGVWTYNKGFPMRALSTVKLISHATCSTPALVEQILCMVLEVVRARSGTQASGDPRQFYVIPSRSEAEASDVVKERSQAYPELRVDLPWYSKSSRLYHHNL